ncbi:MAG TPA: hypothetical protein VFS48_07855 [Solirubrobacterales bacterium]|nr:hypothetical protein [Solirubrobacterales bacterium]
MPAGHIAGLPIEETLLVLGGPAIYLVALGLAVATRNARSRLGALLRQRPRADDRPL